MRTLRCLVITALLVQRTYAAPAGGELTNPAADPSELQADAFVTLKGGSVSAGIGYQWGRGSISASGVKISLAGTHGCPQSDAQQR